MNINLGDESIDAAIKHLATDGGLITGGIADGAAVGDARVGEEGDRGEAKADRSSPNHSWSDGFKGAVSR